MRRSTCTIVFAVAALALVASAAFGYSGTLTWDAAQTQLTAWGSDWPSATTSLYWQVDQTGSIWHYKYILTVPGGDISHFILETSTGIVLGTDIYAYVLSGPINPVGPQQWDNQGGSNPNMPAGGVYGIKFDPAGDFKTWTIEFDSNRRPVWGDFYAKDGGEESVVNSGFTGGAFDPTAYVTRDGTATDNKLAVPDTVVPEVPGICTLLLGLPLVIRKLRYRS